MFVSLYNFHLPNSNLIQIVIVCFLEDQSEVMDESSQESCEDDCTATPTGVSILLSGVLDFNNNALFLSCLNV